MDMAKQKSKNTKRRRVVLVLCPFQGHINPMFRLATILHSRGFSITIAHTIFNSPDPANHPEFAFLPLPDDFSHKKSSFEGIVSAIVRVNTNCGAPLREIMAKMDDLACVIFDDMMYFADPVAKSLNVPSIMLRTSNAATLVARSTVIRLREEGRVALPECLMNEPVPELYPLKYKDLRFWLTEIGKSFWEMLINMSEVKASAIIINTVDCLESEKLVQLKQHRQEPIFPIGPLHKLDPPTASSSSSIFKEDTSCIEWLDMQETNSVLYISLGSIAATEESETMEMAWGLINSEQPFLWVIRPETATAEIAPLLADSSNSKIVKWAPQKEVLAHRAVGAFWSHCGWNSTLESVSEGVPMICRPCFGDQNVNARYLSEVWRVGLMCEIDRLERQSVEKMVKRVMEGTEGEEMRQRAKNFKEKIEASVGYGGSSNNAMNQLVEFILSF